MQNLTEISKDKNSRIDVNAVKEYSTSLADYQAVGNSRALQAFLLQKLTPERINGVVGLMFAIRPSATSEEIESSLVNTKNIRSYSV